MPIHLLKALGIFFVVFGDSSPMCPSQNNFLDLPLLVGPGNGSTSGTSDGSPWPWPYRFGLGQKFKANILADYKIIHH